MWVRVRQIVEGAFRDVSRSRRPLVVTDIAYKALAFAVLTPATALFLRWLLARTGTRMVADADIARFFVTTPSGIVALIAGAVLFTSIVILETSCLMAVGVAANEGTSINARTALAFAARNSRSVLG